MGRAAKKQTKLDQLLLGRRVSNGTLSWMSRGLLSRLVLIISLGILGHMVFLLLTTDGSILAPLRRLSTGYLCLCLLFTLIPWAMHAMRLSIWTRFLGMKLTPKETLSIVIGTHLGAAIPPDCPRRVRDSRGQGIPLMGGNLKGPTL